VNMTKKRKDTIRERLDKFRIKGINEDDCYGWKGAICNRGYPRIMFNGISTGAHRATWMAHYGKIPEFHYVRHTCNNKTCTNPAHLYLSVNIRVPF